jgi:DNA polymerase-3 subunit delta'
MAVSVSATPRFFTIQDLDFDVPLAELSQWNTDLLVHRRTMDHPFNPGLFIEALMAQAHSVLAKPSTVT